MVEHVFYVPFRLVTLALPVWAAGYPEPVVRSSFLIICSNPFGLVKAELRMWNRYVHQLFLMLVADTVTATKSCVKLAHMAAMVAYPQFHVVSLRGARHGQTARMSYVWRA